MSPHYSDYGGRSAVRLRRSCFAVDEPGPATCRRLRPSRWPVPRSHALAVSVRFERHRDWCRVSSSEAHRCATAGLRLDRAGERAARGCAVSATGATRLSPRRGIPFISRGACDGRRRQEAGWRVPRQGGRGQGSGRLRVATFTGDPSCRRSLASCKAGLAGAMTNRQSAGTLSHFSKLCFRLV
jgi:hypothetical protein